MPGTEAVRVLDLVRRGVADTRADLQETLGWSRLTVGLRLKDLVNAGYLKVAPALVSTGGRPAERFAIDPDFGTILVADIGGSKMTVAVTDFVGKALAAFARPLDLADGPVATLRLVRRQIRRLLAQVSRSPDDVVAVGVGVPVAVDPHSGRTLASATVPSWRNVDLASEIAAEYPGAAVAVDRDANIVALGEHRAVWPDHRNIVVVKVGDGLTCGIIAGGELYHGAHGAAGDFAHLPLGGGAPCRCGQTGCLETRASGWALAARLEAAGRRVPTSDDIADLVLAGDPLATKLVGEAGEAIGRALAEVVSVADPSLVVIAGNLARTGSALLEPLRAGLQQRLRPPVRDAIEVVAARLGARAGMTGAALLAQDAACAPERVERFAIVPRESYRV